MFRGSAWGYALSVASVGAALALILVIGDLYGGQVRIVLLAAAVVAAIALAGVGPGLVATVLAAAAALLLAFRFDLHPVDAAVGVISVAVLGLGGVLLWRRTLSTQREVERGARTSADERAFLQGVLDTVPDAIMVIDEKGLLRSFSPASERLFGYTAKEVLGQNVKMLMPSPHYENHDSYLTRYRETGERHIIGIGRVVAGKRRDGSTFPLELAVGEVNAPTGRYFTGFIRDLTERQATEARLQELQSELTHISRLSAMGEMASTLAHELNQPLSAIANYLRGARRLIERPETDSSAVSMALDKAADQALRAGDIIRRLRDFVGRGEEQRSVEPVTKLIEEASALALVGAKELGVQVSFRLDPAVPIVLVDRVQIQQVLVNLIRNAVDAMAGSQRRELVVSTRPADDDMVEVAVSDTGPGIDPAIAPTLFQPFQTTKAHGMGVGLSISRTIIEAHGGRIAVDAHAGAGAVFRFTVPSASVAGEERA
ncbi:MAG: PAS domain S-box protein [Bauldia sp.]